MVTPDARPSRVLVTVLLQPEPGPARDVRLGTPISRIACFTRCQRPVVLSLPVFTHRRPPHPASRVVLGGS